jgi:hypothetical protein
MEEKVNSNVYLQIIDDCSKKVFEIRDKANFIIESSPSKSATLNGPLPTRTTLEGRLVSLLSDLEDLKKSIVV